MTGPTRRGVCNECLHRGELVLAFDRRRWICKSAKDCIARCAARRRRLIQEGAQR